LIIADDLFRALADPTRLRLLLLLAGQGELCVCELTHALAEFQPKISRHLAMLRKLGIVLDRREGLWIHYRLNPKLPAWVHVVLSTAARANNKLEPYARDAKRLKGTPNRPSIRCSA
jgi:DNA-binding transcriptional ArsR family regulator